MWHARVPASVVDLAATANQQAILLRLYRYADRAGLVRIGTRQIARECNLAPGTVTTGLAALRAAGAIVRLETGQGRAASLWQVPTVTPVDNRRSVPIPARSVSIGGTPSVSIGGTITTPLHSTAAAGAAVHNLRHPPDDDGSGWCRCGLPTTNRRRHTA